MNARIQVEHPVTEFVTGIDLVKSADPDRRRASRCVTSCRGPMRLRGHAIECRINAENPETFAPSPGRITGLQSAGRHRSSRGHVGVHGWRDSAVLRFTGREADHLRRDRTEAIRRMQRALGMFIVEGIHTSIPLHQKIMATRNSYRAISVRIFSPG